MEFDPEVYTVDEGGQVLLRIVLSFPAENDTTVDLVTIQDTATGENGVVAME